MSRATCRIYEGTSDCLPRALFNSDEEAWDKSRDVEEWPDYCGDEGQQVIVHSCYGGGREWPGRACLSHMMLTAGDGCMESNLWELWRSVERNPKFYKNACYERHGDRTFAPRADEGKEVT